jgi:outer membrane protein OmpA-like peptidoglycan-associated protein
MLRFSSTRLPRRALPALLAASSIGLVPALAGAQTSTFTVDRLVIAGAPDDGIGVWRPEVARDTRFFGQLGLGFAVNPFRVDNYVDDLNKAEKIAGPPVATQFITYLNAGVELFNRASIQISFPLILNQAGSPTNNPQANLDQNAVDLKSVAPMDMRLEGRFVVYRNPTRSFKLALSAAAFLPTGNKLSFAGDGAAGASFGFATEYAAKSFLVVLNAAYRLRPFASLNELNVSNEVLYGVGGYVPLRKGTLRVGAELFGAFGAGKKNTGDLDTTPLEWNVNGRMYFTKQRQVWAGFSAGTRLTGGYAPDFRSVAVVGGSFGIKDTDPMSPGVRYEFNVSDEADIDQDGITDAIDDCPKEPGVTSKISGQNGCPRFIRRINGSADIEILKQVEFAFDSSNILPVSYPILDEVLRLLEVSPEITLVSIEGHTDNQGKVEYNQKLSEERAASVRAYLVQKGIAAARLTSLGYGMTKPLLSNDTEAGQQRNRRVEFKIKQQVAPVEAPAN